MDLKYVFLFVTILHGVHGLRCLSCQGVIEPRACLHKQECGVGEICYTEQVIDDDLTNYYNVGCRSTQLCDMAKIAFGRRSGELQVCQKCCHTDKCNNQECQNSQGASTNICSKCQDVASPLECQSVVECRSDEICFSQQFVNDNFEKRYNLGCEKKKRCELLRQLAPYHRNLQLCNKCCQGSECNKKLCIAQLPTKAPQIITIITTKATATTLPITATTRSSQTTTTSLTTTTFPTETTSATHASTKLTNTQEKPTQPVCVDIDVRCNSSFYQQILCASKDPSSISLAISTCPKTCNRCDEYFATTPVPITATTVLGTTTPLECIDRETNCSDTFYQSILCTATDQNTKDYALQTCPKACNLCDKLLGLIDSAFGR